MPKQLISFVQTNFQQGPKHLNAFYLPYSVGILWSYVSQFTHIKEKYDLDLLIWRRDPIEETAQKLSNSRVVGFSSYVWNREYNYELAKRTKELNPDTIIIFGGPEPPVTDPNVFKKFPFIDLLVKMEGEITFLKILENLDNGFDDIAGLVINKQGEALDTGNPSRIDNLEQIPSPYLSGVFDRIIKENPNVQWNVTIETNRGCPFMCTFCDWGSLTYNKVKKFELENVFKEIEWFGQNKVGFMTFADANFGVFYERDSLIIDKVIETQKKYGYPVRYQMSWAKNQKQEVVDIVKRMIEQSGTNSGLTLAVQSLTESVLSIIKRTNMEVNKIEEILDLCEKNNIPMYTELIMGLPGETLETWQDTFWKLLRMNNHHGITAYQAQVLENSEMNLFQKKLYKIGSTKVYDYFSSSYTTNDPIKESVDVIVSTKDMPKDKMVDAALFTWYMNTFHIYPISTFLSRFVKLYCDIDYKEFYLGFLEYLQDYQWFKDEQEEMRKFYYHWYEHGTVACDPIQGIEMNGSNLPFRTILRIHSEGKLDEIYDLLEKYMSKFNIDPSLLADIFTFQRNYMITHEKITEYPMNIKLNWNIYDYITDGKELKNQPVEYKLDFKEDKTMTFVNFLELIYFGRRRNFGRALVN